MSHYVIIPGDESVPALDLIKQIEGVDCELVATVIREIVQFAWSGDEDDLICHIERLFPGGAALIHTKSINLIQEA